ncbi:MAG: ADP-ribosylglycohydrolase family protein [Candidatus Lokiarchaeota archaeon]
MQNSIIKSKFLGALIGSALGDCIGELAFRYQNREELIREIINRNIIRYTDDTAMAIGLAESIIENN